MAGIQKHMRVAHSYCNELLLLYSRNLLQGRKFTIFAIKHQLTSLQNVVWNFLLMTGWESWIHCCQAADPVAQQITDPLCCTNHRNDFGKTTFRSTRLSSLQLHMGTQNQLAVFGMVVLHQARPTYFGNSLSSYCHFNIEVHVEFPSRVTISTPRGSGHRLWPCHKIKNWITFWHFGDMWKLLLTKILRYCQQWSEVWHAWYHSALYGNFVLLYYLLKAEGDTMCTQPHLHRWIQSLCAAYWRCKSVCNIATGEQSLHHYWWYTTAALSLWYDTSDTIYTG